MSKQAQIAASVVMAILGIFSCPAWASYSPHGGRFLQRDPINLMGPVLPSSEEYGDGTNLYQYVQDAPPQGIDPSGLKLVRTEKPKSISITFGKGVMKGTLFRSLHCCPKGNKNAGQNRWVTEVKLSGKYNDKKAYSLSDLPSWAGKVGWVLEKLGQEAEVGVKWTVSGTLNARYDDCIEKMTMASGSLSATGTAYGHVDLGFKVNPKKEIEPIVGDLWGQVEWPNKNVVLSFKADIEASVTASGSVQVSGRTATLRGSLDVSGKVSGSYNMWDWQKGSFGPYKGQLDLIKDKEFASYSF